MKNLLVRLHEIREARRESREGGFSMIELIVVVAIIGILVAVAIPVYGNIQQTAKENQLKNAAATGVTVWSAKFAETNTVADAETALALSNTDDYTLASKSGKSTSLSDVCIVATPTSAGALKGVTAQESGRCS